MLALTLIALASIAFPFLVYPALLWANARLAPVEIQRNQITPRVDLVICAYNEADVIEAKVRNAMALDYPEGHLTIWVASDGSTDSTVARARAIGGSRVRVLDLPRAGKAAALTAAVRAGNAPVIAFSDANSSWASYALRALVAPLHDPAVGGVAGDQRYADRSSNPGTEDASGERGYWSFDRILKRWQSRAGNVISATGAIYCIRRELFDPPPADATDDFMVSTGVVAAGRRLVFAEDARAIESTSPSAALEFRRKVRVISRGLRSVYYRRALLDPRRYGIYAIQLVVHKLWRRMVWLPMFLLIAASPLIIHQGGSTSWIATAVLAFTALGVVGLCSKTLRRSPAFSVPAYVLMVNAACALATFNLVRGHRIALWHLPRADAGHRVDPPA